jgi:hypothetical protein
MVYRDHAKHVQCVEMITIEPQNLLAGLLRFGQLSGLQMPRCRGDEARRWRRS